MRRGSPFRRICICVFMVSESGEMCAGGFLGLVALAMVCSSVVPADRENVVRLQAHCASCGHISSSYSGKFYGSEASANFRLLCVKVDALGRVRLGDRTAEFGGIGKGVGIHGIDWGSGEVGVMRSGPCFFPRCRPMMRRRKSRMERELRLRRSCLLRWSI